MTKSIDSDQEYRVDVYECAGCKALSEYQREHESDIGAHTKMVVALDEPDEAEPPPTFD